MWQHYYQPNTLDAALALLAEHRSARVISGGTDILVELSRGVRPTETVIDITRIDELHYVRAEGGLLRIGALATHNDIIASSACVAAALPLAQACWELGAPQIRTRATVAGNVVTASPANDTITPLVALDAELVLVSLHGERSLPIGDFYHGVRRTALRPGELLREIRLPIGGAQRRGMFIKLGLRRAQAISVLNVAVVLEFAAAQADASITAARIAIGCVAPTIVRAVAAERFLLGRALDATACVEAGQLAVEAVAPIDDLRGSAAYRREMVTALISEALRRIAAQTERASWPTHPVLLQTAARPRVPAAVELAPLHTIITTINGEPRQLAGATGKTLLDALREDAGLTGSKEGCAEGECGACTVWLDSQAVMACLVPAAQANGAQVTTIEGLAATEQPDQATQSGALHALQAAFIANGAVQCGYCIPGMLMAGARLLDEHPDPDLAQIQSALSGNICRCTGYRKIIDAVLDAAQTARLRVSS